MREQEKGQSKPTLAIEDEYDIQDLLHEILKLEFDDYLEKGSFTNTYGHTFI